MKKALVFSGGSISDYEKIIPCTKGDFYIICADSGVFHCLNLGLTPDLVVGDFDSSSYAELSNMDTLKTAEFIRLNPVKDDTDTQYALDCAVERGFKDILLIGAVGTRVDHSLANIFLLEKYSKIGVRVTILTENSLIRFLKNDTIHISRSKRKYVSLIPLSTVTASNEGFEYPLNREVLHRDSSRGISNVLINETGSITLESGCALICESEDM